MHPLYLVFLSGLGFCSAAQITYQGLWSSTLNSQPNTQTSCEGRITRQHGSSITWTFNGTFINVSGFFPPNPTVITATLDGAPSSLLSSSSGCGAPIYFNNSLPFTEHTLSLTLAGSASTNDFLSVYSFASCQSRSTRRRSIRRNFSLQQLVRRIFNQLRPTLRRFIRRSFSLQQLVRRIFNQLRPTLRRFIRSNFTLRQLAWRILNRLHPTLKRSIRSDFTLRQLAWRILNRLHPTLKRSIRRNFTLRQLAWRILNRLHPTLKRSIRRNFTLWQLARRILNRLHPTPKRFIRSDFTLRQLARRILNRLHPTLKRSIRRNFTLWQLARRILNRLHPTLKRSIRRNFNHRQLARTTLNRFHPTLRRSITHNFSLRQLARRTLNQSETGGNKETTVHLPVNLGFGDVREDEDRKGIFRNHLFSFAPRHENFRRPKLEALVLAHNEAKHPVDFALGTFHKMRSDQDFSPFLLIPSVPSHRFCIAPQCAQLRVNAYIAHNIHERQRLEKDLFVVSDASDFTLLKSSTVAAPLQEEDEESDPLLNSSTVAALLQKEDEESEAVPEPHPEDEDVERAPKIISPPLLGENGTLVSSLDQITRWRLVKEVGALKLKTVPKKETV
ncbi:hypothetical protein B0H19DRAFT_1268435 [Mycena capillaripes]|nr:hypothetical protein B0H19DRAFT_1268435 [Mycena capillaripes]